MFVFMKLLNPTVTFQVGDLSRVPFKISKLDSERLDNNVETLIKISKSDWDSSELSVDFAFHPILINKKLRNIEESYSQIRSEWEMETANMRDLESENNQILIDGYSLNDEVNSDVLLQEVTLNRNPLFLYSEKDEPEIIFKSDVLREFISYSVGCMFGRYSLEKEGLILSSQGETLENYLKIVPSSSFMPDEDNVIPIIDFDGDWFEDDIAERFKAFLKVTFGEEKFATNIEFIEEAIGKDIKKYFVKDFYADHVKRYKKRPIYWMFSSPKGSFNALIYMHRYQADTASIVLNDYLREFRTKLEARKESYEQIEISASASQKDITQAIKAIAKINKVLEEVNDYEHDVLYPLAGKKVEIDLDDGVKHNYPLFGKALKKVTGLS
jgi:hypothetical protein